MSENPESFKLDISKPEEEFTNHLELEGNKRIVFSGPFGTGKTYFLKEYFKNKPNVFHLYPVNYSFSKNEDIFELVKYDLLYLLLDPERELVFEKTEYTVAQQTFIKLNDPKNNKVVANILRLFSNTGVPAGELYSLIPIIEETLKKEKGYDELKKIEEILTGAENQIGSIYELNDTSKVIKNLLIQAKKKHDNKENILIIDDLDRIDPEHIFRLLNVFAAHFDINEEENKFGFDKVIFVCDIDNIRKIFSNKYGQDTDFNGYIDKFYSREVFAFDNRNMILQKLKEILNAYKFNEPNKSNLSNLSTPDYSLNVELLLKIFEELIKENLINFRSLFKYTKTEFIAEHKILSFSADVNIQSYQLSFFNTLYVIFKVIGNQESFLKSLKKISKVKFNHPMTGGLLMIYNWQKHFFMDEHNLITTINNNIYYYQLKIENRPVVGKYFTGIIKVCRSEKTGNEIASESQEDFFEGLYLAAKTLVDLRILK